MSSENLEEQILTMGKKARAAALKLSTLSTETKNLILKTMASGLRLNEELIIRENKKDLAAAEENGLSSAMLDRLKLDKAGVEAMAAGIEKEARRPSTLTS